MILQREHLEDSTNKLLESINTFSKIARYNIKQKNQLPFYMLTMNYVKKKLRKQFNFQ